MVKVKHVERVCREFEIYPVKLRMARAIRGWSICELSQISGVARKTIEKIEKGNCVSINKSTFDKLILALGMDKEFYLSNINADNYS